MSKKIYNSCQFYNSALAEKENSLTSNISKDALPEILFLTSYPPRECGIATYSQDLITALNKKFGHSFTLSICPIETQNNQHPYSFAPKYILNKDYPQAFKTLAKFINEDEHIFIVMIQHEFGLFANREDNFNEFLLALTKPVVIVFHTVLPKPNSLLKAQVQFMASACKAVIVMTKTSAKILTDDYAISTQKITTIAHGTHLVIHADKNLLKQQYNLVGKKVLSTFGLLSSGKSIETTLYALPQIVNKYPNVLFLIIGKTHPSVVQEEGEQYRNKLQQIVKKLQLQPYVQFVNYFLPLPLLLDYLQLTDIYLFTSNNPNQAVSGTFSYAMSCGCSIISTPIPHALEVVSTNGGLIIDFNNWQQLAQAAINLLSDEFLQKNIGTQGVQIMASTAWENSAIAHANLLKKVSQHTIRLIYNIPIINLAHIKKLTTPIGLLQFSIINQPDSTWGYTLDDNARALIALCQHYQMFGNEEDLIYIQRYFNFIKYCLQPEGHFLNYLDKENKFTHQNNTINLADSNGRAIWALGFLISIGHLLPHKLVLNAEKTLQTALRGVHKIHSTRAIAFILKGLYYYNTANPSEDNIALIKYLANKLVQMYRHEADDKWQWFESYLTYANSVLPEAMLCAWLATQDAIYKNIAQLSFDFLLSKTFSHNRIKVISNKTWLYKNNAAAPEAIGGEQPIDVAYTIMALSKFYAVFNNEKYLQQMLCSFNWFLGDNYLHQIIYNPCTGGCYDGLEENNVNLNQGAESSVSYLMARLTLEKILKNKQKIEPHQLLETYAF